MLIPFIVSSIQKDAINLSEIFFHTLKYMFKTLGYAIDFLKYFCDVARHTR